MKKKSNNAFWNTVMPTLADLLFRVIKLFTVIPAFFVLLIYWMGLFLIDFWADVKEASVLSEKKAKANSIKRDHERRTEIWKSFGNYVLSIFNS